MAINIAKPNPALVEKIFTATNVHILRGVIRENKVGKIIVCPEHYKLLDNCRGSYGSGVIRSISTLLQTKEDNIQTLVVYKCSENVLYAREMYAPYHAILEPEYRLINGHGRLAGEGAMESVRALVERSSALVMGGMIMLDDFGKNAFLDLRNILIEIGVPDFPRTINGLISKFGEKDGIREEEK